MKIIWIFFAEIIKTLVWISVLLLAFWLGWKMGAMGPKFTRTEKETCEWKLKHWGFYERGKQ